MTLETTQEHTPTDIRNNTVILNLTLGKPGNRKKVKRNTVKVTAVENDDPVDIEGDIDPDQNMLHVSKDLLDSPELVAISKLFSEVRQYVQHQALPTHTLKAGMYMLAIKSIARVNEKLKEQFAKLGPMKEAFAEVYPQKIQESMERLGDLSSPLDYPPIEKVLNAFVFEWQLLTFDVPVKIISAISEELLQEEQNKVKAQNAEFADQINASLVNQAKDFVEKLVESLRPTDGKKKKITDKSVEKFNEFVEAFKEKNVMDNQELATQINQAQALVNGATPEEINSNENIKSFIANKMDEIKMNLDAIVVERSERKIYLAPKPATGEESIDHAA